MGNGPSYFYDVCLGLDGEQLAPVSYEIKAVFLAQISRHHFISAGGAAPDLALEKPGALHARKDPDVVKTSGVRESHTTLCAYDFDAIEWLDHKFCGQLSFQGIWLVLPANDRTQQ